MTIRRIVYTFTLISSFFFYILYPPWFSWYLLVIILLMIPLDLLISLPGMLTKDVLVSAPEVLEKNAAGVIKITTIHKKPYPVRCINLKLRVTGEEFAAYCRMTCGAEQNSRSEVTIDTTRTGLFVFEIDELAAVSLIGLFSKEIKAKNRTSVLILPPPVKPVNTIALPRGLVLRPKPGGGFSEEHDMRSYRQGDPVKSIHWKISAKYDSLIIREPLVPPHHSRLVHVMPWDGADERDLILGNLRWVCEYLLKWELAFYIKYSDKNKIAEVQKETDIYDFLLYALDDRAHKTAAPVNVPSRFSWIYRIDASVGVAAHEHEHEHEHEFAWEVK